MCELVRSCLWICQKLHAGLLVCFVCYVKVWLRIIWYIMLAYGMASSGMACLTWTLGTGKSSLDSHIHKGAQCHPYGIFFCSSVCFFSKSCISLMGANKGKQKTINKLFLEHWSMFSLVYGMSLGCDKVYPCEHCIGVFWQPW